jgi:hypothetical protein
MRNSGRCHRPPQDPDDDATGQRPVERLQIGQREAAPAYLLEHRSPDEEIDESGHHVQEQRGRHGRRVEGCDGPGHDRRAEEHDGGDDQEGERVPPKLDSPQHDPAQQAAHAFLPSLAPVTTNADRAGPSTRPMVFQSTSSFPPS